jgi:hypothetical protein
LPKANLAVFEENNLAARKRNLAVSAGNNLARAANLAQ